jgi:putative endonuclease
VNSRRELGDFGERVAAHHLEAHGLRVVARNVRTKRGEIDLIAQDGPDTVFVEVRTRRGSPGLAAESINRAKLRRMHLCANLWCEAEGVPRDLTRLDSVVVELSADGLVVNVEHYRALEHSD